MELTLEGVQGVPDGGVLSIKIGEVRRQASLTKIGQPFRFSSSPVEALPMKYEVLVPIAPSRSVMLDPLQKNVVLELPGNATIQMRKEAVEALQRPIPDVAQIAESRATSNDDKKQMAATAATYLEQHGLVRTFQDLLHGLLVTRPEDPWLYLDEHLARAKAVAGKTGTIPTPTSRSGAPEPAAQPPNDSTRGAPEPKAPLPNDSTRGAIKNRSKVDALMDILVKTKQNLPLILPYLPQAMHDMLVSGELVQECENQFLELDTQKQGKLRPEELLPVLVQLSTAKQQSITKEQCNKFCALFDVDEDGKISCDEFVTLTQFVIIAAHLESPEGMELLRRAQGEESNFKNFLDVIEKDKSRINDVVPFLPDWLVGHLTSDSFLDECMVKFDELDADKNEYLTPDEVVPVVINLSGIDPSSVSLEKCKRFVSIFDVHGNAVIQRDEFLEFAQFLAVTNFLSTSTEGRQIHEAALHQSEVKKCEDLLLQMEEGGVGVLADVIRSLPRSIRKELQGDAFSRECTDGFMRLDANQNGVLDPAELFPLMIQLAEGHPIHMDYDSCMRFTSIFDKDKNGVISFNEFTDLCRFVIVMGYLQFTKEWRESTVEHSREVIDELLVIMKQHRDRLPEVLPLLPDAVLDEITSRAFTKECLDYFTSLDKNNNGSLEPKELVPCVISICQAHPIALTKEQCLKFVDFFDTERTGVISKAEFIDFVRFMIIMAYLEAEETKAAEVASDNLSIGEKKVEELLYMLEHDRNAVHKIVPLLPEKVFNHLTSDEFVRDSHAKFVELDVTKNNVLSPQELFPVIVELSEAHPYSVDLQQCERFTSIFDMHGDGVIRLDEFLDFARFMCIMQYLHSEEGRHEVAEALQILADSKQVEDLIKLLERDWHEMKKVIPYLPDDLRDELLSEHFTLDCLRRFEELDFDSSGSLDSLQVLPIITDMTNAHHLALDESQCARFVAIFDEAKTGVISKQEFVNFARFLMVMSFLQTERGQKTLELVIAHHDDDVPNSTTALVVGAKVQSAPTSPQHSATDLEYYIKKTEALEKENQTQRRRLSEMEITMKALQEKVAQIPTSGF